MVNSDIFLSNGKGQGAKHTRLTSSVRSSFRLSFCTPKKGKKLKTPAAELENEALRRAALLGPKPVLDRAH
jgi:hypothetical protein